MPSSDVYQLGVLMYFALTGQVPIPHRGDDTDYLLRVAGGRMQPIGAVRADLDPAAIAFIDRCLHPQPARRFLDAASFHIALEQVP
jgi:serine/threonine-protein kinase